MFEQGMTASQPSNVGWTAAQADVPCLQQTALSEITEIIAGGTLNHIDGEFEQANFPSVIHAMNDRAERFVFTFDFAPGSIDH
jgi:hypothetical protein